MRWLLLQIGKVGGLLIAATLPIAAAAPVHAGLLVSADEAGSIEMASGPLPPVLLGSSSDFSVLGWVRRTTSADTGTRGILAGGSALRVAFDDDAGALRVEMRGTPDLSVSVPLAGPGGPLPVNEWMLWAVTWDADAGALTAWAQSPSVNRVEAAAADETWSGTSPFPFTLGAIDGSPGFAGQIGLTVVRSHAIGGSDFDLVWNGGTPNYFAPMSLETGSFDGFTGVAWMIGHGVVTNPRTFINPNGVGAIIGDAVTTDNVLVYSSGDSSNEVSVGTVANVTGAWNFGSPHEPTEAWSGFFVRETPNLGLDGGSTQSQVAPASRCLALDEPHGLIRVMASANSRSTKFSTSYDRLDNWAYGGLYESRRSSVAGVFVPARMPATRWPFLHHVARIEGDVNESTSTPYASAAFGSFGSHGVDNPAFPGFLLSGRAVVIEPGSAYIPKARPETGTRLDEAADAVTVRTMVLRFPGAGSAHCEGAKATSQTTATYTTVGPPQVVSLDTTAVIHAMAPRDAYQASINTLLIENAPGGITVGDGCFIGSGPGKDGISMIVDVKVVGTTTTITLERPFPVDPVPGMSELRFGPVEAIWLEHAWAGLEKTDPEIFRGLRLEAADGLVVVLYVECFNPDVDGFIIGGTGRAGRGYAAQLDQLFDASRIPFVSALAPDVWLQFFAHQGSPPGAMGDYAAALQRSSNPIEIWWCGDPDFDFLTVDLEGTDAWQQYILDNAEASGVGAIVAHEHHWIGTGFERAADGQVADAVHPTARGARAYLEAVLDLMQDAALDPPLACPGDLDEDGEIDFADLTTLLAVWGPCAAPCPADLDEDGLVAFSDLTALLAVWGLCR